MSIKPQNLTVLIGENGAGKSTLLHALRLLFDPTARQLHADLGETDINSEALAAGERWFTIRIVLGGLEQHPDLSAVFLESVDRDHDSDFVSILGTFSADDEGCLEWAVVVEPPHGSKAAARPFTRRMAGMLPLLYVDPVRDAGREARLARGTVLQRLFDDIELGSVETQVIAALKTATDHLSSTPDIANLQRSITTLAAELIPGGHAQVSFGFAEHDTRQLLRSLNVVLGTRPDDPPTALLRQGTGYQNLVLIAIYAHLRSKLYSTHPILVIEEPEAHLHPHAQRRLLRTLKNVGGVTFVSTHAPAILERVEPHDLVRLHAGPSGAAEAHQLPPSAPDSELSRDYELATRGARSEALFARAIVVVEGPSEALTLPVFAEVLGLDLDRDGISIFDASGSGFGYALRVFDPNALGIPLVVTYDTDSLESNANLVTAAYRSDLVDKHAWQVARTGGAPEREQVLNSLGWIGARRNFEQVLCEAGYCGVMKAAIESEGQGKRFREFEAGNEQLRVAEVVSRFIAETPKLKIPVARAVAAEAASVAKVPACYERALQLAVKKAVG